MGKRIVGGLIFAALSALLVWAALVSLGDLREYLLSSAGNSSFSAESSDGEDVLFDDDSTVDWSDPLTEVFDPVSEDDAETVLPAPPKTYEFALTAEYFDVILEKYSDGIPFRNLSSEFSSGYVILSGAADVDALAALLEIPAALVVFLPDAVDCTLACVPKVEEGRLRVSVSKVRAGSDILAPFLSTDGILSAAENYLNNLLTEHLPSEYRMQSATVTEGGLYIRFSVETKD